MASRVTCPQPGQVRAWPWNSVTTALTLGSSGWSGLGRPHLAGRLRKGTPREWFIKTFLERHLSQRCEFGTGEVIDAGSLPGAQRNQLDTSRGFPRSSPNRASPTPPRRRRWTLPTNRPGLVPRNALFLAAVLAHGFRRLLPP
jgi:hypothetical protein